MGKLKVLMIIAVIALLFGSCGEKTNAQVNGGKNLYKQLTKGDSLFTAYVPGEEGYYEVVRATLKNPHATIIDTVYLNHISKNYGTGLGSDTTRIGWKKWSQSSNSVQNDTVYTQVYLQPGEEIEILVWLPFPDRLQWVMYNYTTGAKLNVKERLFNR